ncbi:MAG TPA: M14-type cytosolic carboxypeptidase [Tepidisphaeraceae bacterium]|jgi:hypothetical protein
MVRDRFHRLAAAIVLVIVIPIFVLADDRPITFNKNFEDASLGRIEALGPNEFRCHVEGQCDQRGHNRQASWYFFRVDAAAGRDLTLTLTDFVGEYNDKPGAVPMAKGILPVYSDDGVHWRHFDSSAVTWDDQKKEATLRLRPAGDSIWIAHVAPYTASDLSRLLTELDRSPYARVEVIGRTAQGRDLHMVTVTDFATPDAGKKVLWLQARQHAWEAGTSYVMDGALRFITSGDPRAADLRRRAVFRFTPMVDVDGCATGKVRFNANGYDVNRHWAAVDLRDKAWLARSPEVWYAKRAITTAGPIDLMVNLHNTETNEYLDTRADDPAVVKVMNRFYDLLVQHSTFDPARKLEPHKTAVDDTNMLYDQYRIPVMLMEQRIAAGKKLGHCPTVEDRRQFGRDLIINMAASVLE